MAAAVVGAAFSVALKALAPVTDSVLEAWAASKDLGPNVKALKTELLCVKAVLEDNIGREVHNSALEELLRKLHDLAYDAEGVLDKLDYFRMQDELDGTFEAVDEHPKGCGHNLILNATNTAKAVGKLIWLPLPACCSSAATLGVTRRARGPVSSWLHTNQNTIRAVGKCLPCSSLPSAFDDDDNDDDDGGGKVPREHEKEITKSEFNRVDVSKRIKLILQQLQPMCQKICMLLGPLGSNQSTVSNIKQSHPVTTSESIEPKLYGRDHIKNSIIYDITQGKYCAEGLTTIPIVGPGGIGKTTLTQYIYHNQDVQKHFDVKVWICVSLNFNVDKLMEGIEKYIPKVENENIGTAAELIRQRLKSKRVLLVLDDVWTHCNEDEWKRLLLPFRKSQVKGNVIIVTTRLPAIARMVKTSDQSINLEGLDRKEFKKLFLAFVFGDEESTKDHIMLLETGDKILDKLKGNPLAAKTVGRLLRDRLDLNNWERILENKEWESEKGDHNIMPALKLSYDYLPFHLQQCFSYCALFPKDYEFDSEELIHFWIGLGVLQSSGPSKTIEDIGLISLNDLVSHGFFKKEKILWRPFYLIHDLLHDLALKEAQECLSVDRSNVRSLEIRPSVRHLSIIVDRADDRDGIRDVDFLSKLRILKTSLKIESLQTIMVSGSLDESFAEFFRDLIRESKSLHVLHLSRMSYCSCDQSILHNLPTLSHLRYLGLEEVHSSEVHLPSMLPRLYHLRILDLQAWRGCPDLPRDMSNLTKLRHFLTKDDEAHSEICNVGKLQFLQELKRFEVNKESDGFDLKQLGNLVELRKLKIYGLEKIHTKEEAADAKLIYKNHLLKLTLDWHTGNPKNDRDGTGEILEGLQPQRNLQELCINGHGSRSCPTWLGSKLSIKALRSLHLAGVDWEVLPMLGHMGMLHELTLKRMSKLKEFGPSHLGSVTDRSLGDHCHFLYQLKVLIIEDCPGLLGLPFLENFYYPPRQDQEWRTHWFPNLQELEIRKCPKVVLLPPIPWTHTLCSVKIDEVESSILESLRYSKSRLRHSKWQRGLVELNINVKDIMHSLEEKVLVIKNLTDLEELSIMSCPSLDLKDLHMLTSLYSLRIENSTFVLPGSEGEVKCQVPVERLLIDQCRVTGKELTQLLSHLPKLSELYIWEIYSRKDSRRRRFEMITQMGVAVEQQQPTAAHIPAPSGSAVRTAQATCQQQEIAEEAEQIENGDDGLLLFPAHLSGSLRTLVIRDCPELILAAYPPLPEDGDCETGRYGEGGGLDVLRSLQELKIQHCPKLFSSYRKISFPSTCFPFPSSLKKLHLLFVEGMGTLEPISNLTSLTHLELYWCGDDLRGEGLWPLATRGQLSELWVRRSPRFFYGSDPMRGFQDEDQEQILCRSCKLRKLTTDDVSGFLDAPICTILSSTLTELTLKGNYKLVRFTKEQEDALQLLASLQDLTFGLFGELECLPACLHTLPKLKRLQISFCDLISSLPENGLPVSLQELDVRSCSNEELEQQCRNFIRDHPGIKLVL